MTLNPDTIAGEEFDDNMDEFDEYEYEYDLCEFQDDTMNTPCILPADHEGDHKEIE